MTDSQGRIVFGAVLPAFFVTSAPHSQTTRPTLRASDSTLTWIGDEQAASGHSVGTWLPWCTSAILKPMSRMREAFGEIDVAAVLKLDPTEQKRMNDAFARNRGFAPISR